MTRKRIATGIGPLAAVLCTVVLSGCHQTRGPYQGVYKDLHYGKLTLTRAFPDPKEAALVRAAVHGDVAKMHRLVKEGADVNYGKGGGAPLVWVMARPNYKGVEALLKLGANPNQQITDTGNSPMTLAAARCDPRMLKLMLDYGGNPNAVRGKPTKMRESALEMTVEGLEDPNVALAGCYKNIHMLAQAGANVNYADEGGLTAATTARDPRVIAYLLKHGYSYDLPGVATTVETISPDKWTRRVIAMLRKRGVAYPPLGINDAFPSPQARALLDAADDSDIAKLRKLVNAGADPNHVGRRGWTPLTWVRGEEPEQEMLLKVGADPNQKRPGRRYGNAAMFLAAGRCNPKTLSLMLAYGGNPNIKGLDAAKTSALEIAAEHFCTQNVELLVKHHANINYVDKDGGTAATKALAFKNFRLLARLLQLGYSHDLHDLAARVIATPAVPYKQPWKQRVVALLHQRGIAVPATSTAPTPTTL